MTRASTIAWLAPFDPTGYMTWAASPMRHTRPSTQWSTGSRSTIGNSQTAGAPVTRASMSNQSKSQSAKAGRKASRSTSRFQSLAASPPLVSTVSSAIQFWSWSPVAGSVREIG